MNLKYIFRITAVIGTITLIKNTDASIETLNAQTKGSSLTIVQEGPAQTAEITLEDLQKLAGQIQEPLSLQAYKQSTEKILKAIHLYALSIVLGLGLILIIDFLRLEHRLRSIKNELDEIKKEPKRNNTWDTQ